MGKCNPASKQVEEMKNEQESDESVDELMEKYNQILEETKRSITPSDVIEYLPENAKMVDDQLVVEDSVRHYADTAKLTQSRKEILQELRDGSTPAEIKEKGVASQSHVSRTKSLFGFILEHPALKEAFLSKSRVRPKWELVDPESDTRLSYESKENLIEDIKHLRSVFDTFPDVYRNGQLVSDEFEEEENNEESSKEFSQGFGHPLDTEDWKKIIAALNRDDQDELANFIIDKLL